MKIETENKPMSFDEALQDPTLSHFHELIHYLEKTPNKDIFPKKYEMSIQGLTTRKVQSLFDENPEMSLKDVLCNVIAYLPDGLSAKQILKMTQVTIKTWETLSKDVLIENKLVQTVGR